LPVIHKIFPSWCVAIFWERLCTPFKVRPYNDLKLPNFPAISLTMRNGNSFHHTNIKSELQ